MTESTSSYPPPLSPHIFKDATPLDRTTTSSLSYYLHLCLQPSFRFFLTLFCCFSGMGLVNALIGPSLLELGEQTHSSTSELIYIFSARSFGFFMGTIVGGYIVDKWRYYGITQLFISMFFTSFFTFIFPHISSLYFLIFVGFLQGLTLGCIDNIAQVLVIELKGKNVGPYMQALHGAYGIGAFLSPLILSPFLGSDAFIPASSDVSDSAPSTITSEDGDKHQHRNSGIATHHFISSSSSNGSSGNSTALIPTRAISGSDTYHYAYYLIALLLLPICIILARYMFAREISYQQLKQKVLRFIYQHSGGDGDGDGDGGESRATLQASPASTPGIDTQNDSSNSSSNQLRNDNNAHADNNSNNHHNNNNSSPELSNPSIATIHIESLMHDDDGDVQDEMRRKQSDGEEGGEAETDRSMETDSTNTSVSDMSHAQRIDVLPNNNNNSMNKNEHDRASSSSSSASSNNAVIVLTDSQRWKMVALLSLFLFLYVGCETGYGSLLFLYGVKELMMDVSVAAYLTSFFWFCFATGRMIGVPISMYFSATTMIFADLLGCILSLLLIIIFHDSTAVLWLGTFIYGLSVASIYPSAINYAETQFKVTGKVLSILVVCASFGDAIVPVLMGLSFASPTGPLGLMLIASGVAVSATLVFAVLVGCVAPVKDVILHSKQQSTKQKQRRKSKAAGGSAKKSSRKSGMNGMNAHVEGDEESMVEMSGMTTTKHTKRPSTIAVAASKLKAARSGYSAVQQHADIHEHEHENEHEHDDSKENGVNTHHRPHDDDDHDRIDIDIDPPSRMQKSDSVSSSPARSRTASDVPDL